ncbi:MAG: peptide ABC transporter substrate-binding protein [Pseudohongiellaceae bacterium]
MTEEADTITGSSEGFVQSAARQLSLYAFYALAAIVVLLVLLSFAMSYTTSASGIGQAIDAENNQITIAIRQEPPQMDHTRTTDVQSFTVLAHVMEGLLTYDDNNELAPGMAERWELRDDGATFWIRDDAYWSDGEPVTAHDFVFSWRKTLEPANGSQYAFILYPITNAEAVNTGELPPEYLGVNVVTDKVLAVEFEQPTPYFDKLAAFATYYPLREDFYHSTNGRYGADADQMLYNGPYVLTDWIHSASMRWEKNPRYWDSGNKALIDVINVGYITEDVNAKLNMFKDGQIADTHLVAPMLKNAMEQRWPIDRFMDGTVFFLQLNFREGHMTANTNFRKALQLAQDPVEFVYKALKEPSYLPGESLFPVWIRGVDGLFRQEYPPVTHRINVAQAREHLEMAKQELGLDEFPPLILLADDSPVGDITSEYYQEIFQKNLGLEVRIDKQIFKQRLQKMESGEFDIVIAGWGPDYDDALTFGDLFATWNLNNRGRYSNAEFDRNVRIGQTSLDQQERMDAFGEIQRMVYEDVVILPIYERGWSFVVDPGLKNFKRRSIGPETDYRFAYLEAAD